MKQPSIVNLEILEPIKLIKTHPNGISKYVWDATIASFDLTSNGGVRITLEAGPYSIRKTDS
jgi:hypothetical protein